MIIIAGYGLVPAEQRDDRVNAYRELVARARKADGCIHMAITADTVDPERFELVEVWRDSAALDAWRKKARGPRHEAPKYLSIKRYDATDGGPL